MWPCIVACDRASWHVTVHRGMWLCIVTCDRASWRDRASWHVTVHRGVWLCIVTCDRASWHVTVHRGMWLCIVACDCASWHVTVHRDMWPCIVTNFLIIKPTGCTNFSNLFWKWKSTCFGQFLCPSSGVIHCTLSNDICRKVFVDSFRAGSEYSILILLLESYLQTCLTCSIAACTVNNSWWWAEELSETRRISFPK
jgi:hypothetical protein